jgi:hypothetical protein
VRTFEALLDQEKKSTPLQVALRAGCPCRQFAELYSKCVNLITLLCIVEVVSMLSVCLCKS